MPHTDALNGSAPDRLEISRDVARRFLALHHLLAPPRSLPAAPTSVMTVFDRIGSIQFDPIDVTGRNHDLVLLARIAGYRREWTDGLLYKQRALFEVFNKMLSIVPMDELPWYRVAWDRSRMLHEETFGEHGPLVEELVERIRATGPMSSTDLEPRAAIDWSWRPTNQVRAILEALSEAGILGISRREGNRRVYDLAERLFPAELLAERRPPREQFRHKLLSRYRGHGLLGATGPYELFASTYFSRVLGIEDGLPRGIATKKLVLGDLVESGQLLAATVEGVRGVRYVVATELPLLRQAEREVAAGLPPGGREPGVAMLAPLDPLVWDREFLRGLYGFDYIWEVYVPAAKRRWGYYVLPVLYGDRLVGRIEPRMDRKAGALRILGAWWEDGFDPLGDEAFAMALGEALEAHRAFAGADRIIWPRTARLRALADLVKRSPRVERQVPA